MAEWKPKFKVNGISVPIPDNYSQVISDLSSAEAGRNLAGVMQKDVIAVKTSIPLEWQYMEWQQAAELAKAVDGKNKITVAYMDVRNPYAMTEKEVYIGDRNFEPLEFDSDGKVYWSVKFSEIEV